MNFQRCHTHDTKYGVDATYEDLCAKKKYLGYG